jgi:hypothetical protein
MPESIGQFIRGIRYTRPANQGIGSMKSRLSGTVFVVLSAVPLFAQAPPQGPPLFQVGWGEIFFTVQGTNRDPGSGGQTCDSSVANPYPNPKLAAAPATPCTINPALYVDKPFNRQFFDPTFQVQLSESGVHAGHAGQNNISADTLVSGFSDPSQAFIPVIETRSEYYQENLRSPVAAGGSLSLTYLIQGSAAVNGCLTVNISVVSDDPTQSVSFVPDLGINCTASRTSTANVNLQVTTPPLIIGPSGTYSLLVTATAQQDSVGESKVQVQGCGLSVKVTGNGTPNIVAVATPVSFDTLHETASACGGYIGFDFQQSITNLPCPSPYVAAGSSNPPFPTSDNVCPQGLAGATPGNLTAGLPFNDPPPGGYTYATLRGGGPYMAYPFYYPPMIATTPNTPLPDMSFGGGPFMSFLAPNSADVSLQFGDRPSDPCLPTEQTTSGPVSSQTQVDLAINRAKFCAGNTAPLGSHMAFITSLVAVAPDLSPSNPLAVWTWTDTFNGTAGGIAGLSPSPPIDPGSGVGYITITSMNGVPIPPIIPPTQVSTKASGLAYSRVSQTFNGTVTITNIGAGSLSGPFQLLLNSLTGGVTLVNAVGLSNGDPYLTIPNLVSLAAGQSVTVAVQFSNPSNTVISFTPEVYSGSFQ